MDGLILKVALRELAALMPGEVVIPGDAERDERRLGWTRRACASPVSTRS
ncbi:hypothetical protein [Lentzea pudingi]|nr:hypothetical protein [Lentzea pudingi]